MDKIDVTLVAGSRPDLLKRTLESFTAHIFSQIQVGNVFVNIDLHGGSEDDRNQCKRLVLETFPAAQITTPASNSFGQAVKSLWSLPTSTYFLHFEDDWIASKKLPIKRILRNSDASIQQWFLVKPRVSHSIITKYPCRPNPNFPFFFPHYGHPSFTTSPSILRSDFAHQVSFYLRPELNPEKQMFNEMNIPLEKYLSNYRSKSLINWWESRILTDIGRKWQASKGIRVEIVDGVHTYNKIHPNS